MDCAFTGGLQTFTVPANVDSVTFNVYGAQGARPSQSTLAGEGGVEHGTVSVTPGETLTILVGGEGQGGAGGFGGGADGGAGSIAGGGGGGGGSFIYHGDGNLIVAAGGGGGSGIGASNSCLTNGGGGGGDAGSSGCGGAPSSADAGGGTQSQGGSAGNGADDGGAAGRGPASWSSGAPVPGAGGAGGAADYGGGGGGGGYYGGGGSGGVGSGGGGSGYLGPGVTDQRFFSGSSPGNGHVSINYLTPTPPEINSAPVGQFSAGEAGSFEITATGVPTPTLSQGGGPLPAGLTFTDQGNGIATITGTPAAGTEGVYSITVTASNGVGYDFGETVTLYVRQPCPQGAPAAGGRWVVTCSYDGQIETFTVPAGVTSVSLDVKGAQGGASSSGDAGALGGEATATFPVSYSGEVLTVIAGGRGTDGVASPSPSGGPGGYGGGGEGGSGSGGSGGGGGGGSYVFNRAGDLLAVGGGGAGAVVGGCNGGSGGGTNGADDGCGTGGRGGRSQEGGRGTIGGTGVSSGSGPASISDDIPTFGQGGNGGTFDVGGGGGGGGYYGGGGGAGGTPGPPPHAAGGGGGGSGFVAGSGVDTTQTSGVSSGDGVITITYTPAPPTAMITSPVSGRTFRQGQVVATSFRCIDSSSGPGVSSCKDSRGVSAPHGHLNTSTLGRHTYQVTAMSEDGQHATQTITYTVKPRPPVCTVRQPGGAVLLPAKGKQPTGRQGQIEVKVTCNQHVAMRVAGSLRSVLGNQTRTFSLARVSVPAAAGRASSAVLKLPSGALTQLRKGARQSVSLTLTGTNANGRWSGRATIARLHGVVG